MQVEVIVTSIKEAILAEQYGANRLELIHAFELGGLSPALELSKQVCNSVKIPVNIMLRPHGNSYIYNKNDTQQIMTELNYLKSKTKANAIVFGALTNNKTIDIKLLQDIINYKGSLKLVFHRAIDETADIIKSYKQLLNYEEIDTILTSGGKTTAKEGVNIINQMVELGNKFSFCKIMAGSGITPENAKDIITVTRVRQIHIGNGIRTNGVLDKNKFDQLLAAIN